MHRFNERWMFWKKGLIVFLYYYTGTATAWTSRLRTTSARDDDVLRLPVEFPPDRRVVMRRTGAAMVSALLLLVRTAPGVPPCQAAEDTTITNEILSTSRSLLRVIRDDESYSGLSYTPPDTFGKKPPPLIVVLHGAGKNDLDILRDLGDPRGEHAGLIPSLIQSGEAPPELLDNFAVLAPYSYGKASFYQDSRSKLLKFIQFASTKMEFDPNRVFLFGFSDGATVAVELMTTRRFAGAVICSYGYSGGALPQQAMERLSGLPMWVFHAADDVIFDIRTTSDRLVEQLQTVSADKIRYTRYEHDPEHLPARVRGHSMGITASKLPEVYTWMLNQQPRMSPSR